MCAVRKMILIILAFLIPCAASLADDQAEHGNESRRFDARERGQQFTSNDVDQQHERGKKPDAAGAPSAPILTIAGIRVTGNPIIVFDNLNDKKERAEIPDVQPGAWKEADGTINLTVSHYEDYRMRGRDLAHLVSDPHKIYSSTAAASDADEQHYNYHHWFAAPYTLDGKSIYMLVHSEWYGCLLNKDCTGSNQLNSWVSSLSLFRSMDGGASWGAVGANQEHVVAKVGYVWDKSPALAKAVYRKSMDHSGIMTPSRIIKEGDYYYTIGVLVQRDFSKLDSATGEAPQGKYGYILMRTRDVTRPASWEAWANGGNYVPIESGKFNAFRAKRNNAPLNAAQMQIVYDTKAKVYVAIFTLYGNPGAVFYMTTKSLENPSWSDALPIAGTDTFKVDPRSKSPDAACNKGFGASNYVSLFDQHSAGLNFEFTDGDPMLFYVVNPAGCGGDNMARDIYRLQLTIDYR